MREQDIAAGYPSLALPYEPDAPDRKPSEIVLSFPPLAGHGMDPLTFVLDRLDIGEVEFEAARRAAWANGTDCASELIAAGVVDPSALADATASALGLARRTPDALPSTAARDDVRNSPRMLRSLGSRHRVTIAPRLEDLGSVADFIAARPDLASDLTVASQADLAAVRAAATWASRSEDARLSLSRDRLDVSARITVTGSQGFAAALALAGLAYLFGATSWGSTAFHAATLLLYIGCISLRFAAATSLLGRSDSPVPLLQAPGAVESAPRHPVYSVLVALRGETADTVGALVGSLDALDWPKSRLQIFMVCEDDDADTVATVRNAVRGRPWYRLVQVPPSFPRTKPKALNFALPLADGEFIVLYDAEDKPSPHQLTDAWETFGRAGPELACLQAPLVVTNGGRGWLPAHFAIEYATLFLGLLPWLADRNMPLPLGGTSNHFRRDALVAVGGWDSHNVTEDADLGMRLARSGYRTGTIAAPTFEEAPERWEDWHKQRTRWMKGYMQTWLVHMRAPLRLLREIGLRDLIVFQLLFAGMILSSTLNTVVLGALLYNLCRVLVAGLPAGLEGVLIYLDAVVLVLGFAAYAMLATLACRRAGLREILTELWTVPAYWLLVSFATCRAIQHLAVKPHHWEKTPHGHAARKEQHALER